MTNAGTRATTAAAMTAALGAIAVPANAQEAVALPGEDVALEAEFKEVYHVGGIDGADWEQFGDIGHAGFDREGNLYFFDAQASEIVVVSPEGRLVRRFGRSGDGPGELRFARSMAVMRDGRVVITDMGHNAYVVFGPDGEYERMVRSDVGPDADTATARDMAARLAGLRRGVADPSGFALIAVQEGAPTLTISAGPGGVSSESAPSDRLVERVLLDGDEASTTTIADAWAPQTTMSDGGKIELPAGVQVSGGEGGAAVVLSSLDLRRQMPPIFEPGLHAGPLPDGSVAFADSTTYAIKIVREGEGVIRTLTRPIPPLPVTRRVERAWRERQLKALEAAEDEDGEDRRVSGGGNMFTIVSRPSLELRRKQIEEAKFYEEVPAVRDLRTTWNGRIWVRRRAEDGVANGPWDVLSSEGRYVGTYPPSIVVPDAFGPGGLAAYVELGEYDVATVRVVRLPTDVN